MAVDQVTVQNLRYLFPSWPDELIQMFSENWVETGDRELALAITRASPEFEQFFPGIKRSDGSLRMTEQDYLMARQMFDTELLSIGINPEYFGGTFVDLVAGEVSPREMIARIEAAYSSVIDRSPEIRAWYAQQNGLIDLTDSAIVASFLDPRVGDQILTRQVAVAEIGAAASTRGLDLALSIAERLYEVGIGTDQATKSFGQAAESLPVLDVLAKRHNDPDDDFDINEFTQATLLDDPFQRRRIRRLLNQESALFTETVGVARDRRGVGGITAR